MKFPLGKQTDFIGLTVVAGTLLLGFYISTFGKPYVYHPDEIFILKRPFKRLLEYTSGDFSSTFSFYDFLLLAWYGLYLGIGWLLDWWSSLAGFKDEIILEKFHIIYFGRILSVLFVAIGNVAYYKLFSQWHKNKYLLASLIILNPVLIPSVFWIKYDGLMYLAFAGLMFTSVRYLINRQANLRPWVYLLSFIAISIRIEASLFLICFAMFDWVTLFREKSAIFNKRLFIFIGIGVVWWCVFTLYPLHWLRNLWNDSEIGLLATKSYEGEITKSLLNNISNWENLKQTALYYISILFALLAPFVITFFMSAMKNRVARFYAFYVFGFIALLILNGYKSVHYILPVTPIIIAIGLFEVQGKRWSNLFLFGSIAFTISVSIQFLLLNREPDPRVLAREYILRETTLMDTIAIETLSMNGYHLNIPERPSVLRKKAGFAASINGAEGVGYLKRANQLHDTIESRYMLDVFDNNYLSNDPRQSNEFINTYDSAHLLSVNPRFLVSVVGRSDFAFLKGRYTKSATFKPYNFPDPRCHLLYSYVPEILIFKRRN